MVKIDEIIVVCGPTATGKSDIANDLADKINGEVVSADSMQIYKGMDIGTGKISERTRKVKHWGLDIVEPSTPYSAALFQDYARDAFDKIISKSKTPILCGGTGFYIRAAIDDYDFPKGEQQDNPIREKYNKIAQMHGAHALWEILNEKDKRSAALIHENNVVRVVRALEIFEEGKSYADQVESLQNIKQKYPAKFFGLKVNPEILKNRIDKRVDKMIEAGLVDEVKTLLDQGFKDALTSASAIGYKEIVEHLEGRCSLDEAVKQIKTATKQYAKRQRTWFNKDKRIHWINYNEIDFDSAVKEIILYCDKDQ